MKKTIIILSVLFFLLLIGSIALTLSSPSLFSEIDQTTKTLVAFSLVSALLLLWASLVLPLIAGGALFDLCGPRSESKPKLNYIAKHDKDTHARIAAIKKLSLSSSNLDLEHIAINDEDYNVRATASEVIKKEREKKLTGPEEEVSQKTKSADYRGCENCGDPLLDWDYNYCQSCEDAINGGDD